MKKYALIVVMFCISMSLIAQRTINESFSMNKNQALHLTFNYADVSVQMVDGNTLSIEGAVVINNGENDDAFKIKQSKKNGKQLIETYIKDIDKLPQIVTIKKGGQVYYFKKEKNERDLMKKIKKEIGDGGFDMYSAGVQNEIKLIVKVPKEMKVSVESLYGDLVLQDLSGNTKVVSTYGDIEAQIASNAKLNDIRLHSIYGFVDLALAQNTKANLDLESGYGQIFTDLDISVDTEKSKEKAFASHIIGDVNGGGPRLQLKADYDNIYLRGK